jgi:CDP-diacylglycerol--glycerol-3-phosphate 3-phosphatidyltransferase/cardiolipin synthase
LRGWISVMDTGRYRARDALLAPGLLSLARVPLAVLFPLVVSESAWALTVLVLAGVTDVIDGYVARRFGLVTPTGAALDPVTDKVFVLTVAVTLIATGHLSAFFVLLLSTRELLELPLVLWFATSRRARHARAKNPSANVFGKLATFLQFAAVIAALLRSGSTTSWVWATAVAGVVAAASYWKRALTLDTAKG